MRVHYVLGGCIIVIICFIYFNLRMSLPFKIKSILYNQQNINISHKVIILTRQPTVKVLNHFNVLMNAGVNTFIMTDREPVNYTNQTDRIIYIEDETVLKYGLKRNRVWDKAFVWLYNQSWIDYVWLMEDDVTWRNVHDILKIFNKYSNNAADLLSRNIIFRTKETLGWIWWPQTPLDLFPQSKWSGSLNMLSRVSRRLIDAHKYYTYKLLEEIKKNATKPIDGNYYYQEFFIPTVANMFNLKMIIYDHSKMDVHVIGLDEKTILKSLKTGKTIFHPVKHDSQLLSNATYY